MLMVEPFCCLLLRVSKRGMGRKKPRKTRMNKGKLAKGFTSSHLFYSTSREWARLDYKQGGGGRLGSFHFVLALAFQVPI